MHRYMYMVLKPMNVMNYCIGLRCSWDQTAVNNYQSWITCSLFLWIAICGLWFIIHTCSFVDVARKLHIHVRVQYSNQQMTKKMLKRLNPITFTIGQSNMKVVKCSWKDWRADFLHSSYLLCRAQCRLAIHRKLLRTEVRYRKIIVRNILSCEKTCVMLHKNLFVPCNFCA